MARLDAAAVTANKKVLLHPAKSREVVASSNEVAIKVGDFHGLLGIDGGREALEQRRWADAATEARTQMLEVGGEGVDAALRLGGEGLDRAKSVTGRLSKRIGELPSRRRGDVED